jgi:hypothetical protein
MSILLPIGVALFVLPLLLVALYARHIEKIQRRRMSEVSGNLEHLEDVA